MGKGPYRQAATVRGERQGKVWLSKLQEARIAKRMTLKQAAAGIKISISYLNRLEHGTHDPTLSLAHRIAEFYEKSVSGLWVDLLLV